jgi:hypothetical protein
VLQEPTPQPHRDGTALTFGPLVATTCAQEVRVRRTAFQVRQTGWRTGVRGVLAPTVGPNVEDHLAVDVYPRCPPCCGGGISRRGKERGVLWLEPSVVAGEIGRRQAAALNDNS